MSFQIAAMMYAFLFTVRGIPQIYYGSETGLEGYKNIGGTNNEPLPNVADESALYQTVKKLINLRKNSDALKYGVVITLWVDNFVYAFLRYFRDEVVIVVFNNGYQPMQFPLQIPIGPSVVKDNQPLPDRVILLLSNAPLVNIFAPAESIQLQNGVLPMSVNGKSFKIFSTK